MRTVLALDVGGTKLAAGVMDAEGTLLSSASAPTHVSEGPQRVVGSLLRLGHAVLHAAGISAVEAVGIGCGGPLDPVSGEILGAPHLPGWDRVPLGSLAADEFGAPFVLANDGTAAAWGEYRFGSGRATTSMVYLTVSTGIGGGMVLGGRLLIGASGNGGEPGHIVVRPGGRSCWCGRRGCLECYASGTAVAAIATERLAAGEPSALVVPVTAADVARGARSGDALARAVWDQATSALGAAITDIVNLVEPDVAVLGGGMTRDRDQLLAPVVACVRAGAARPIRDRVRIALAAGGDLVGVVGAGAIALDRDELADHRREEAHVA